MVSVSAWQPGDDNLNMAPTMTNTFGVYAFYTYSVASAYGHVFQPELGTYTNIEEAVLTNFVSSPVDAGTTQYVCTGWTLTGSAPPSGTGVVAQFTLTNNAVLTWIWTTNYWVEAASTPNGTIGLNADWYAFGTNLEVQSYPASYYHFTNWTGQVPPGHIYDHPLNLEIDSPKTIGAVFDPNTTSLGTP